jgi:hypothetical protein
MAEAVENADTRDAPALFLKVNNTAARLVRRRPRAAA